MQKQAYKVIQAIHHDGVFYSPHLYPFEQSVIYAYPHEVSGAVSVGAIILDPSITVPKEVEETSPVETSNTQKTTQFLKPIA